MSDIKQKVWITKEGTKLPVSKMETSHLKSAFTNLAQREFETHQKLTVLYGKIDTYIELRKMLAEELSKRGVTPLYPDQRYKHFEYGNYFEAERKTMAMPESPKIVISAEQETNPPG